MAGGGGVTVVGRAEIDTRAPFRSVKEAVVLFGEKVLAGELHAGAGRRLATSDQLQQNRAATAPPILWPIVNQQQVAGAVAAATRHVPPVTAELEEAKQELEKERSEKQKMAGCILSLQEELSNAMRELKKLKARDHHDGGEAAAKVIDLQVEDLKFVEIDNNPQQRQQPPSTVTAAGSASPSEFQKRRYVTFADPPTAPAYRAPPQAPSPDVVVMEQHQRRNAPAPPQYREVPFQRQMSAGHEAVKAVAADQEARKKKKKPLIPLVGALFMRKKKSSSSSSCHDDSALNF
ncbi:hypothetical protein E2562_034691 [Oryza meyeriana var. granulata]|uniref:Uncharacterized protein n=1 Tax=Oryza meyeriana var. granulata TaxID=110450 RepID=A0A6G1C3H4_9ORYZ|nr:hypothetical protein E2562_034691 [Oryza meyeriana var. granulata]